MTVGCRSGTGPPGAPVADTVHGYWVPLDRPHGAGLTDLLSPSESKRLDAFVNERDRRRFLTAAVMVRLLVGQRTGTAPERVLVTRTCPTCAREHGRPEVAGGPVVSVSHSGDMVAVAVGARGLLGVDVERLDRPVDTDALAAHVLAPQERAALRDEPDPDARRLRFLASWTVREAALKAGGTGLRAPVSSVTVLVEGPEGGDLLLPGVPPLRFRHVRPAQTCVAALVTEPGRRVVEHYVTEVDRSGFRCGTHRT